MTTSEAASPEEFIPPLSKKWLPAWVGPLAILILLGLALYLLYGELRQYHYKDISYAIFDLPRQSVFRAFLFTAIAYAMLPSYDVIALSYVGRPLPLHRVAFSSFISYGISQTLGFPLITGSSVRFRFWSSWGLSTAEIAQAISFVAATFTLGIVFLSGTVFLLEPKETMAIIGLPHAVLRACGVLLLAIVGAYLSWSAAQRRPLRIGGWEFPIPTLRLTAFQLAISAADWAAAGAVLYVLLPLGTQLGFLPFLGAFLLAQFAGQISHVPGGLGVFETLMVILLKPYIPAATTVGALVAFRAIYYLVPFALSMIALASYEVARQRVRVAHAATTVSGFALQWGPAIFPRVLSASTFIAGVILLISGATPSARDRVSQLDAVLPLGILELSHVAGSLAGAGLVVLSWAVARRLDAAWRLTVVLLGVGIVASLLKGLDWEQAVALSGIMLLVLPSHRAFYRRTALTTEPLGPAWTVTIILVSAATIWLGFFSYKHVAFSNQLWLRFATHDDAPRFLRATAVTVGALMIFGLIRLLRHVEADPSLPTPEELDRAGKLLKSSSDSIANLVFLGDKSLMFSASGNTFLMYGVEGRSWVALGDPKGADDEVMELAWHFREEADRHGAWPVFYEVGKDHLPLYIDLGLTMLKLGEAAIVPLPTFSLEGARRKGLRRCVTEVTRHDVDFSVVSPPALDPLLPELKRVSDDWLAEKHTREKGFSLGRFDEAYLRRFPMGVLRRDGVIVAFANLLCSGDGSEISVDLMRYTPAAPASVMEYLFIELLQWGRDRGFQRFNLGMAPLSGLQNRALAPMWNRAGALLYRHGEHFYNFRGLRQYKDKFNPSWEPRYLASPGGLALPRILASTAALISGGLRGVVSR